MQIRFGQRRVKSAMVHYSAYFSVAEGTESDAALRAVTEFLRALQQKGLITRFSLLENCNVDGKTTLPRFQADVVFESTEKMAEPFRLVAADTDPYVHEHAAMMAHVQGLVAEVFREISPQ
jgi:hypothetical protein